MADNTAIEEIDKESLVGLLKEKGKEIKSLENKNKKLEERYVKIFRENKNLAKDKDTLEKLLQIILDKDQEKFTNVESGNYDLTVLTELWNQRNAERSNISNEVFEKVKLEKADLEKKIASLQEELNKAHNQSPEIEKRVESHKHHALELEKANEKLNQEIKELNGVIEERDQQIAKLRNVEGDMEVLKAEVLMKELELKTMNNDLNIKGKMQENDRKNEVLRLRQQVDTLQMKVKEFEAEKENGRLAKLSNSKTQSTQTEIQSPPSPPNHAKFEAGPPYNHHLGSSDTYSRRKESDGLSQSSEGNQLNQEYFKNVVLKLFCYIEGNNLKEAKVLMDAIIIMLKMSPEDKDKIEEAKKNNTMWNNTVHFIKDTFT